MKQSGGNGVAGYYFYDLNGKINWKINDKSRVYLSSYFGDDNFYLRLKDSYSVGDRTVEDNINAGLSWGNATTALRYNRVLSTKLFMNVTGTFSRYNFDIGQGMKSVSTPSDPAIDSDLSFDYKSLISDWSGRIDFDYIPSTNHYIKFGLGDIYHTFVPGINVFKSDFGSEEGIDTTFGAVPVYAHEYFAFVEDDFKIGSRFKVNLGLHFSGFITPNSQYQSLQPRVSARYLITEKLSVKASYAQMQQYIHLLTNASIGLPTDLWVPSTAKVKPENSHQWALGLAQTVREKYEVSVEGYYKTMNNLIEYKEGSSYFSSGSNWEDQIEFGRGWSYGGEVFLQKKAGKTTGWVGYTLSWTNRQFENLNFGKPFPYRYDRRHDLSIVVTHEFSKKIDVAATWVYGTGNSVSLPVERYAAPISTNLGFYGGEVAYYQSRNGYRMAAYHRLDLAANFNKVKKYWTRTWSLGVYNAYSRKNPFYLYFDETTENDPFGNPQQVKQLKQVSLFPIIPYAAYNFCF
jgi:hypothetical protein